MRKRLNTLLLGLILGSTCASYAQVYENDEEIIFTDERGKREVIEYPPSMNPMYSELDSLLATYHAMTYMGMDDNCEPASSSPEYDRSVYIDRLQRMNTIIEMPYNEIVRRFIDRYANRMRRQVAVMLAAANFYMPIFEDALESYGVPLELKYLPVIESALNPKAVSRAGATGLWQFMLGTGKQYGLRVNSLVDDRRDPVRSSYAAARYLRDLNRIFKDWTLALAAYNCGPENVNRAIRRAGGTKDYWKIYPYLPSETRGYVPAFIAANYIMTYYCDHNICPMTATLPEHTDTVMVSKDVHLRQIAQFCDVNINMLRELNPQYRKDIVNGNSEPAILRMPTAACTLFAENEDSIYNYRRSQYITHRREVEVSDGRSGRTSSRSNNTASASSSSSSNDSSEGEATTSASSSSSNNSYSSGSYSSSRYGNRYGNYNSYGNNRYGSSSRYGRYGESRYGSHSSRHSQVAPPPPPVTKGSHKGKKAEVAPPPPAPATKGSKKGKKAEVAPPPPAPATKGSKKGKKAEVAPPPPAPAAKADKKGKKGTAAPEPAPTAKGAKGKGKKAEAAPAAPAAKDKGGKGKGKQAEAAPAKASKSKQQAAPAKAPAKKDSKSASKGKKK